MSQIHTVGRREKWWELPALRVSSSHVGSITAGQGKSDFTLHETEDSVGFGAGK